MSLKYTAYCFKSQMDRSKALFEIEHNYPYLLTSQVDQITPEGENILFIESKNSLQFDMLIESIVRKHGGVTRRKVVGNY